MDTFAKLKTADRQPYFEETANRRNSTTTAIEKDFWVCWTLQHLFALKNIPELRFKGGTSLSKVFRLINRFSEDIDISINRAALGFFGDRDPANIAHSGTKRRALNEELRIAITKEIQSNVFPKLHAVFVAKLGKHGWDLSLSKEDNEEMTLVFQYPAAFKYESYLRPQIKIEFGRGDQQPSQHSPVIPTVAEEFPEVFPEGPATIAVLDSQRTFWEKVTLLHAENHRPDATTLKSRMSRHWSDVAVMSTADQFTDAKLSTLMLQAVIGFKQTFFPMAWAHYETARPGTILILPNERLAKVLREDYSHMREMFPADPLPFDELLRKLQYLQTRLNSLKAQE
jgi:nucleotidyltransferase AbiEii toxin of type IV toxin-antitoxin system